MKEKKKRAVHTPISYARQSGAVLILINRVDFTVVIRAFLGSLQAWGTLTVGDNPPPLSHYNK